MISDADVKANVCKTRRNKRTGGLLHLYYKKYLQNLKYNVKKGVYLINLVGIPPSSILSVKNRGEGGLLNG